LFVPSRLAIWIRQPKARNGNPKWQPAELSCAVTISPTGHGPSLTLIPLEAHMPHYPKLALQPRLPQPRADLVRQAAKLYITEAVLIMQAGSSNPDRDMSVLLTVSSELRMRSSDKVQSHAFISWRVHVDSPLGLLDERSGELFKLILTSCV